MPRRIRDVIESSFEKLIFASRWIQAPIYFGLIIVTLIYAIQFFNEVIYIVSDFKNFDEVKLMISVLGLIDITMVINLLIVVIIGGYVTFVSKIDIDDHKDKPEWLGKMDAGSLKIKLIVSLVSISGVHLLKTFVNIDHYELDKVIIQIVIHVVFIISALLLALTDKINHNKSCD